MASLVLGAVGAYLGSFVGQPGLGFMIGSSIGSWLTAPDQYGPKLGEVKVQSSSFGTPIPIPYGVPPPFAGTVIWEDQIAPHENSQSAGGKGGPQVITYTYTQSYAIAICEGPIAAVVRVWKNGKLIYNVGAGADAATLAKLPANLKLYLGTSTQLPDPTIEAVVGAGKVSAYRGTVYAVLTDDDVTQNGGIAWQYKFEVATAGSMSGSLVWDSFVKIDSYYEPTSAYYEGNWMVAPFADGDGVHVFKARVEWTGVLDIPLTPLEHWIVPYSGSPYKIKSVSGLKVRDSPFDPSQAGKTAYGFQWALCDEAGIGALAKRPGDNHICLAFIDANLTFSYYSDVDAYATSLSQFELSSFIRLKGRNYAFTSDTSGGIQHASFWVDGVQKPIHGTDGNLQTVQRCWYSENYVWFTTDEATDRVHRYDLDGNWVDSINMPTSTTELSLRFVWDDDHMVLRKPSTSDLYLYSLSNASYAATPWLSDETGKHGSDWELQGGFASESYHATIFPISTNAAISWESLGGTVAFPHTGVAHRWTARFAPTDVILKDVQTDLCERCGLTTGEINVIQLTDIEPGYAVMGRMPGRTASEPLLARHFYDSGEWDGKLNFIKRGAASAGLIPLDDLSAHSFGSQPPDPVIKTRNDRTVLPTQVDVNYYNPANDNQAGLQTARRFTVDNDNPITLSFSTLVMSDEQAKGVAEVNLFNFWANANPIQFSTGPKWQHLTPTDVIDIENYGTVRITNKHEGVNGVIQFDAVTEQPSIYGLTAIGSGGTQTGQTSVAFQGPTRLELLDIPILRDEDDDYGFYVGMDGFLAGWKSGTAFKSIDGGTTYAAFLTDSDPGTMGYTSTALADWDGSNRLDYQSVVRVELDAGDTLSSITFTQLLQNGNACLIGSEVVQFQTATLISTGVYDLSGLLRGRKGTEWACTGHAVGERFVMLDSTTIKRVGAPTTEIALPLAYKGVTAGNSIASAPEQDFTNTGVGKKPYAPVLIGAAKDSYNGWWAIKWARRGRIDNQWHAYASMPLGEASEKYEVDIYDSTGVTFKRTLSGLTSPAAHYLLSDATTDGTTTHFVAKVYQLGALGRGYAGTLTV